jgi:integrase
MRDSSRLTAVAVKNKRKPGRYGDGGGLYLLVKPTGKSWVFRWRDRITGKHRDKGLGPAAGGWAVGLEEARHRAEECRRQLRDGLDPIEVKRQAVANAKLERARMLTFGECCARYMAAHRDGWRNAKHAAQWESTLNTYAGTLQALPVAAIDTALVIKALEPIWTTKTETATRVRQRIEAVLDWAAAREFRAGENPARWRGHLDKLLPKPAKLKNVTPRAALPYAEVAEFMVQLRRHEGLGARALELQILTACRPGEVAGAEWREIDLAAATWTIPGVRMKAGRDHRVPLSPAAVALLRKLKPQAGRFVFPGTKGRPLTTAAMLKALRTVREGFDAHGFRSSFRDWCADCTAYPGDIAEAALAHALKDKTEAAYKRTDLFNRRAQLMAEWATFCNASGAAPMEVAAPGHERGKTPRASR